MLAGGYKSWISITIRPLTLQQIHQMRGWKCYRKFIYAHHPLQKQFCERILPSNPSIKLTKDHLILRIPLQISRYRMLLFEDRSTSKQVVLLGGTQRCIKQRPHHQPSNVKKNIHSLFIRWPKSSLIVTALPSTYYLPWVYINKISFLCIREVNISKARYL